jgi:transcriptional regulator with XRE-family HTH domain
VREGNPAYNPCNMNAEVQRLISILRTAMRILGVTNREVERRLGMSPSYLTRLFSGGIELKAEHLIEIPKAIGLEPAEFFQLAYPRRVQPGSRAFAHLHEMLRELQPPPEEKRPEPLTDEQVERMLRATLLKLMGKEAEEPKKGKKG